MAAEYVDGSCEICGVPNVTATTDRPFFEVHYLDKTAPGISRIRLCFEHGREFEEELKKHRWRRRDVYSVLSIVAILRDRREKATQ